MTAKKLATKMSVSPSRVNNIIQDICSKLNLANENITGLREYINTLKT